MTSASAICCVEKVSKGVYSRVSWGAYQKGSHKRRGVTCKEASKVAK